MTPATTKGTRRLVMAPQLTGETELYVAEVKQYELTLRPYRAKRGGPAEVSIPWGAIYLRQVAEQVNAERRAKKLRRGRGRR